MQMSVKKENSTLLMKEIQKHSEINTCKGHVFNYNLLISVTLNFAFAILFPPAPPPGLLQPLSLLVQPSHLPRVLFVFFSVGNYI